MRTIFASSMIFVVLGMFAEMGAAEQPAAQANTPSAKIPADETPEQALVRGTRVIDQLDVDAAMDLYRYSGDLEKQFVKAYCKYAIEATRVELAVKKRFGQDKSEAMLHAIGEFAESDLQNATYKTDGDTATMQYPGQTEPGLHMIRVNGIWKINVHVELKDMSDDDLKQEIKNSETHAKNIHPLAEKVANGEYKSVDEIIDQLKQAIESQTDSSQPKK
jgi:hypothetical protein